MSRNDTARKSKTETAFQLMEEMREMLNDIAASATVLGSTPFDGVWTARTLASNLHRTLLEFEIGLATLGRHEFEVKK